MIFTGLVQLDDNHIPQAQMAASYFRSPDGLTYTFYLKPGLHFSDGTPLTSHDVAYSIDRALSPSVAKHSGISLTYLGLLRDAKARTRGKIPSLINDSILTPNDSTVILKVSKQTAYFPSALAYPTSYVVEKSVIDKWGAKWTDHLADNGGQGGAGPFKVKSYVPGQSFVLVPNPRYYGPKPQLQEINQSFYSSPTSNYLAYQADQVDVTAIPPEQYPQLQNNKELRQSDELAIEYIAMNYLIKPFDSIEIRQAFELALDKDTIVNTVWKNEYKPTCHIVPHGMYGYNEHLQCPAGASTAGDGLKAKQLFNDGLREEGLTLATLPSLKISYGSGSPDLEKEITAERQMWKDVLGIDVKAQALDGLSLFSAIFQSVNNPHGLQMWVASWSADYPDPQDWLTLQFGDGPSYNAVNYGNNASTHAQQQKQVQQAMDAADILTNSDARLHAYNQAEQQLVNDVAWLPLYQRRDFCLRKSYVMGFPTASATLPPNDWAKVSIAPH